MELKLRAFSENYEMIKARKEAHRKVELEEAHKVAIEVCNKFQEYLDNNPENMLFKRDLFERFLKTMLLITDNNMPVMTGVELYHAMRGNRDLAPIPVIFHSYGYVSRKGMTEAYNSPKSSDPEDLMWVIDYVNP